MDKKQKEASLRMAGVFAGAGAVVANGGLALLHMIKENSLSLVNMVTEVPPAVPVVLGLFGAGIGMLSYGLVKMLTPRPVPDALRVPR